jgi:hypothetical protein
LFTDVFRSRSLLYTIHCVTQLHASTRGEVSSRTLCLTWDIRGSQATHPVPLPRSTTPAEPTYLATNGSVGAAPARETAKAPAFMDIEATSGLQHPLSTLQEWCCHHHMQDSLPASWLAFTGRELNPLDCVEGFPSCYISSSLPGFSLTLPTFRPKSLALVSRRLDDGRRSDSRQAPSELHPRPTTGAWF